MQPLTKFPQYSITEDGRVWSHKTDSFLMAVVQNSGYVRVYLDGLYRNLARLVAETYLPNPEGLPEVNHKDEVKTNNHKDNLEWCTRSYNQSYSKSKDHVFISPKGDVIAVRNLRAFCREYGLNRGSISRLYSGRQEQTKGWRLGSALD